MPIRSAADRSIVLANSSTGWSLIRKTSLSSDRSDGVRSSSRHKHRSTTASHAPFGTNERSRSNARRLRIDHDLRHDRLSEQSYLFTMSDISQSSRAHTYGFAAGTHEARNCSRRTSVDFEEPLISRASKRDLDWWSQTGSNRRPPACKAGALPTELWPPLRNQQSEISHERRLLTDF